MPNHSFLKAGLAAALCAMPLLALPAMAQADQAKTSMSFHRKSLDTGGGTLLYGVIKTNPNVKACREKRRISVYRTPIGGGEKKKIASITTGAFEDQRFFEWEYRVFKPGVYNVAAPSTSECGRGRPKRSLSISDPNS
jgi:hypothetical protein